MAAFDDSLATGCIVTDWLQGGQDHKDALRNSVVQPAAVWDLVQGAADHEINVQQQQHLQ